MTQVVLNLLFGALLKNFQRLGILIQQYCQQKQSRRTLLTQILACHQKEKDAISGFSPQPSAVLQFSLAQFKKMFSMGLQSFVIKMEKNIQNQSFHKEKAQAFKILAAKWNLDVKCFIFEYINLRERFLIKLAHSSNNQDLLIKFIKKQKYPNVTVKPQQLKAQQKCQNPQSCYSILNFDEQHHRQNRFRKSQKQIASVLVQRNQLMQSKLQKYLSKIKKKSTANKSNQDIQSHSSPVKKWLIFSSKSIQALNYQIYKERRTKGSIYSKSKTLAKVKKTMLQLQTKNIQTQALISSVPSSKKNFRLKLQRKSKQKRLKNQQSIFKLNFIKELSQFINKL